MNYSQYLQGGGSMQAPMSDEQALAHKKEVDNQMAEAIKQNPASLDQAVQEYGDNAPSFIKHMIDVAAENQDEELLEILKPYAEKFNIMSFRCGGKVRAKIKKACSGKKMEKGGEAPIKKEAKGEKPCPCTLHKVGGKLIEVDCNGVPVAKNGAVLKAQLGWKVPVDTGKPAYMYDLEAHRDPLLDGIIAYKSLQDKQKAEAAAQARAQKQKEFENTFVGGGINYGRKNPFQVVRESMTPKEQSAYNPYAELQQSLAAKRQAALTEQAKERVAAQAAASAPQTTQKNTFGTGKQGKFGGLTYDEALARQNEMLAAKAQGFNVDLGRWGADGKWGNQSRSEWERYQQWKADQELAAMKAQNSGLQRIEPAALNPTRITVDNSTATAPLAVTKNGNIVRTSSLTPGQALSQLNTPAWEEYTRRLRQGILSSKNGGKMSYADYLK